MSILKGVLQEELERNLQKQSVFQDELNKYPKGSLCIVTVHGDKYLYRKYREGNKIISKYIGLLDSDAAKQAYFQRNKYIQLKKDVKELKEEEIKLRKVLKIYD